MCRVKNGTTNLLRHGLNLLVKGPNRHFLNLLLPFAVGAKLEIDTSNDIEGASDRDRQDGIHHKRSRGPMKSGSGAAIAPLRVGDNRRAPRLRLRLGKQPGSHESDKDHHPADNERARLCFLPRARESS